MNKKIEIEVSKIHKELKKLLEFLLEEFDMYPYKKIIGNYRGCMAPTLNIDRLGLGGQEEHLKHQKLFKELHNTFLDFEEKYHSFRKIVKIKLQI